MDYTLKQFDTPLIRFTAGIGAEPNVQILWVDESNRKS